MDNPVVATRLMKTIMNIAITAELFFNNEIILFLKINNTNCKTENLLLFIVNHTAL